MELAFKIIAILLLLGDATLDLMYIQKHNEEENTTQKINIMISVILILLAGWLGAGAVVIVLLAILAYKKYRNFR